MRDFPSLTKGTGEGEPQKPESIPQSVKPLTRLGPNLERFTVNLTEKGRQGNVDPVLGRDPEIRQVIDILMRRRQNNPILTGEAGVGKTAIVEGFALRVAQRRGSTGAAKCRSFDAGPRSSAGGRGDQGGI